MGAHLFYVESWCVVAVWALIFGTSELCPAFARRWPWLYAAREELRSVCNTAFMWCVWWQIAAGWNTSDAAADATAVFPRWLSTPTEVELSEKVWFSIIAYNIGDLWFLYRMRKLAWHWQLHHGVLLMAVVAVMTTDALPIFLTALSLFEVSSILFHVRELTKCGLLTNGFARAVVQHYKPLYIVTRGGACLFMVGHMAAFWWYIRSQCPAEEYGRVLACLVIQTVVSAGIAVFSLGAITMLLARKRRLSPDQPAL